MVLRHPTKNRSHDHVWVWLRKLTVAMAPFLIASQWRGTFLFCRVTTPYWLTSTVNFAVNWIYVNTLVYILFNAHQSHHCVLWHSHRHGHQSSNCDQMPWTTGEPQLHWLINSVMEQKYIYRSYLCSNSIVWKISGDVHTHQLLKLITVNTNIYTAYYAVH